jgi:hypothetical protein
VPSAWQLKKAPRMIVVTSDFVRPNMPWYRNPDRNRKKPDYDYDHDYDYESLAINFDPVVGGADF